MSHFSLPGDLRQQVRRHKQNKWQLTRGVELDSFVRDFPLDLKMAIKRHICLPSLQRLFLCALDPKTPQLPFSTRTVKALTDVQAFALVADDLLFLASQFRSFCSRHVQNTFRYYSHHRRTRAARYIQSAWRKHWKRKQKNILEDKSKREQDANGTSTLSLGASIYVSRFSSNSLRNLRRNHNTDVSTPMMQQSLPLGKVFS
ncbi:hypothetical protein L1987_63043 [Smallanthus sonchifolius]|uniref:Uncharacterized protein n=1 Tax=Smallanthus sonchifolius TaxID=185202 RepID=A0ACB9CCE5_9ASTR|nr:hypothetical protein L1987_63043 [Smallanthus sonchifolius]